MFCWAFYLDIILTPSGVNTDHTIVVMVMGKCAISSESFIRRAKVSDNYMKLVSDTE